MHMVKMNWKRAIITGIISYAVLFLVASALMFVPGMYDWTIMKWELWANAVVMALSFVIVFLLAQKFYFKAKPKKAVMEGLILGIVMMAISFLIEIPFMVYGFAKPMGWAWFAQWNLILGYILGVVAAITAAVTKK